MIRKIRIRNFRSIVDQTISTEEISILVGNNDAGKSNVLRALNLFFNGETDHNQKFDFESDFANSAKVGKGKAKEIVVELILKLPESYRRDDQDEVYWKKVWRSEGEWKQLERLTFAGQTLENKLRAGKEFPPRVKIPSLLANIKYFYIPAIKDKSFFVELQGKMYDALLGLYGGRLHDSAKNFEDSINSEFDDLIRDLNATFSSENKILLPRNLRSIFENLEINSDAIPLSRRGDGIKVRHIPAMLLCIEKGNLDRERNTIRPHIWGFEEPENNVEYSACYKLRDELISAAKKKIQIFITTHSPIIYTLPSSGEISPDLKISRHYVTKLRISSGKDDVLDVDDMQGSLFDYVGEKYPENNSGKFETILSSIDEAEIHENIGFMPLVSAAFEGEREKWNKKIFALEEINNTWKNEIRQRDLPHIFLEGESDKKIIHRAMKLYFPDLLDKFVFYTGEANSANAAADRAQAHYLINKHRKDKSVSTILILDKDEAGQKARGRLEDALKGSDYGRLLKIIYFDPGATHNLLSEGFNVDKCLEAYYPESIWSYAKDNGWLELKKKSKILTECKKNQFIDVQGSLKIEECTKFLTGVERYLALYSVKDVGKIGMSNYILGMSDEEILKNGFFEEIKDRVLSEIRKTIA